MDGSALTPEVVSVADFPLALKPKQKKTLIDYLEKLQTLDEFENPDTPTETYLDAQSGKYVKMLEALVEVGRQSGLVEFTAATLFGLLKMTKVGRQKIDVNSTTVSKLRDENDFKNVSDEDLAKLLGKDS